MRDGWVAGEFQLEETHVKATWRTELGMLEELAGKQHG